MEKQDQELERLLFVDQERPRVGALDWLLFPLFAVTFIAVLLIFDLLQRVCHAISYLQFERCINLMCRVLNRSLKMVGTRIESRRETPLLKPEVPYIIVCNHQSMFDIPLLHEMFEELYPRFISKQELARFIPSVSYNLRAGGSALIDRSDPRQALQEISDYAARARERKHATVFFPEGTRARRGALKKFKTSGFVQLYRELGSPPVIPAVIDGAWKLSSYSKGPIPAGVRVAVVSGPIITAEQAGSPEEVLERCRQFMIENLRTLRS